MKKYKVIIFDLDGTAIPNKPNGHPSKKLIATINEAQDKLKLCAATGRPITNAHYILKELNLEDPCIISAGTQIVNPQTKEILWEESMSVSDANKVLEICSPYPYEVLFREELIGHGKPAFKRKVDEPVNVIYVMQVSKSDSVTILKQLKKVKGITGSGVFSWIQNGVDIHITSSKATKEHSVQELLNILKLTKKDSIGVGDGDNDIHLFKSVGLKVAMGNATDYMKSNADIITKSVDEDGLAQIVEEYSK